MFATEGHRAVYLRSWRIVAVSIVTVATSACRSTLAPSGFIPLVEVAERSAVGSWVDVLRVVDGTTSLTSGELIAVNRDSIFVFDSNALRVVPMIGVQSVMVARYDYRTGGLPAWGGLGTISTLSHGYYMFLSAPIWVAVWSATTVHFNHQAFDNTVEVDRMRPYARFPQGIPPTVDRGTLTAAVRPRAAPKR